MIEEALSRFGEIREVRFMEAKESGKNMVWKLTVFRRFLSSYLLTVIRERQSFFSAQVLAHEVHWKI